MLFILFRSNFDQILVFFQQYKHVFMKKLTAIFPLILLQVLFIFSCEKKEAIIEDPLEIGDVYEGGIIFYLDPTGVHGLVCLPYDLEPSAWGSEEIFSCDQLRYLPVPPEQSDFLNFARFIGLPDEIGKGYENTIKIVFTCSGRDIAARRCYDLVSDGFDDWFLPSADELKLIFSNLTAETGGFQNSYYWSSSIQGEQRWLTPGYTPDIMPYRVYNPTAIHINGSITSIPFSGTLYDSSTFSNLYCVRPVRAF